MKLLILLGFLAYCSCLGLEEFVDIVTDVKRFFRTQCLHIARDEAGGKWVFLILKNVPPFLYYITT